MKTLFIFFIDRIYCYFFVFYPVRRIYIWSTMIWIYFITFIMSTIKDKLTTFHQFQIILTSIFQWIKKLFYYFIFFAINHDFYFVILLFFECITRSSSLSMEETKLFAIANSIFHVSDFLRRFIMSFKYGVILFRYSSTDKLLFLSPLL